MLILYSLLINVIIQEGEDIFALAARADKQENCNSRLVEILREENYSLKRELETYYQRVRKLQKVSRMCKYTSVFPGGYNQGFLRWRGGGHFAFCGDKA